MGVRKEISPLLLVSVLLVAPSASLAGPVPSPQQSPTVSNDAAPSATAVPQNTNSAHPVVIPWGQGVAVGGGQQPLSGFIYCAGCSPINPSQLVFPTNIPLNKAFSASGVLPPQIAKAAQEGGFTLEQQLNGLGGGQEEPGKGQNIWDDGSVPVQQMALHDDGRYSFSYNTAHASRQEERNLDGDVSGSYSYTDPEGKLVQIDYTAGPRGYQAYGENVPPQPVLQVPQPVQDTLEVQMARQQFLDAYNRELERIQRDQEAAAAQAATSTASPEGVSSTTPSSSEVTDESNDAPVVSNDEGEETDDDAVIVSGKTELEGGDVVAQPQDDLKPVPVPESGEGVTDDEADSIVISAKGENEQDDEKTPVRSSLPDPSYQITIPIGVGGNAGLSFQQGQLSGARVEEESGNNNIGQGQQAVPAQQSTAGKSNLQPFFYYVSVGGQPHYVTSYSQPGYNSPYPTSLKATLLGAMPLAAVHDTQVPNRAPGTATSAGGQSNNAAIRPVFLDLENSLKLDQQQQQPQVASGQQQQQQQAPFIINPASLFSQNQNSNPMLGQLIPLGLGNTATFAYIPALILNNNGNGAAQSTQGSQTNNVPLTQQQQQISSIPSLNNQPVIVLASKK